MDLTNCMRGHFLTLPSLALVEAIRRRNKDGVLAAFDQDPILATIGRCLTAEKPPQARISLHLAGYVRLPSTRTVAVMRAVSYEATVCAVELAIYNMLGLRFAHTRDAMALRQGLRDDALRAAIEKAALGARPGILFPETTVGDPCWNELDLRTRKVETFQMNGIDDGFNDELYLMNLVGEFDDVAPHGHWLFDLERAKALPPRVPCADLSVRRRP